jgi:hypothetical protein
MNMQWQLLICYHNRSLSQEESSPKPAYLYTRQDQALASGILGHNTLYMNMSHYYIGQYEERIRENGECRASLGVCAHLCQDCTNS